MKNQKSTPTKQSTNKEMAEAKRRSKPSNAKSDVWEFYLDNASKWRWKRTAPNGEIVGASTQGYVAKYDCVANAKRNGWKG